LAVTPSPPVRSPAEPSAEARTGRRWILWITVGVALWGAFHAVGAYTLNHNPWRAAMVLGAVAMFLAFWWALLAVAARRPRPDKTRV
jgi:hypothetical protein